MSTQGCVCTGAQASAGKSGFLAVPRFFWELLAQGWAEVPQSSRKVKGWGGRLLMGPWRGIVDTGSLPKHAHGCATGWAEETIPTQTNPAAKTKMQFSPRSALRWQPAAGGMPARLHRRGDMDQGGGCCWGETAVGLLCAWATQARTVNTKPSDGLFFSLSCLAREVGQSLDSLCTPSRTNLDTRQRLLRGMRGQSWSLG